MKRSSTGAVLYFKVTMQRSKTFHFSGILIEIYTKTVRLFALDFTSNLELTIKYVRQQGSSHIYRQQDTAAEMSFRLQLKFAL